MPSIAAGGTIVDMPDEPATKQATPRTTTWPAPARWCLLALAILSLALGIAGIFLPVLPTVPFLLLAAWAASHSSPRLSHWLENHPRLGPPITDWRRAGLVSRRSKWAATAAMTASAIATLLLLRAHWAGVAAVAVMACVLAWLWLRPERAEKNN